MNTTKKLLLGLGGLATIGMAAATVVSCSQQEDPIISGVDTYSTKHQVAEKIKKSIDEKKFTKNSAKLITAGGRADDKSFNESLYEAMTMFSNESDNSTSSLLAETTKNAELDEKYTNTLNDKTKIWVLSGFQQAQYFDTWLAKPGNYQKFIDNKSIAVSVDWDENTGWFDADGVPQKTEQLINLKNAGQLITLNFKPQESSYILGWAAAGYLSEKFGDKAKVNTFGGGTFDGVTNFTNGFLQAILDWNTTNPTKKVRFSGGKGDKVNSLNLSTGFDSSAAAASTAISDANLSDAQILFPVAGSLTDSLLNKLSGQKNRMIIGVDANYSLAKPNDVDQIFSSAEKKVGVVLYQALIMLGDKSILKAIAPTTNPLLTFVEGKTSVAFKGGYAWDAVGQSENLNSNSETKTLINKYINDSYNKFYTQPGKFSPTTPLENWKNVADAANNQEELDDLVRQINS